MRLIIVHYHLRPGGIRRVIELATRHLLRGAPRPVSVVTLATGEPPDGKWGRLFRESLAPVPLELFVESAFGYSSEQRVAPSMLRKQITRALSLLLGEDDTTNCVVWAHNLGIGRNLLLARELSHACAARGIRLLSHHHDWWFENRWNRWPEMRRSGFHRLSPVAQAVLPDAPEVHHITISQADLRPVARHFGRRAAWLPNLSEPTQRPTPTRVRETRAWLRYRLGDAGAPVWLLPCRLLRRKNVAEAVLLTRWLRPEAWLVTTGDVSSADEMAYAERLSAAARRHHWRVRLGILAGDESHKPSVPELLAASECVILTSIQEGFGLPYLEAAAARRPLIARILPHIAPDLARFGFRFAQTYEDILVDPALFDWREEVERQEALFQQWHARLPASCRPLVGTPRLLDRSAVPRPVPLSRLTLTAQLEILVQPASHSWRLCAPLNSFLLHWKQRAAVRQLETTRWPASANRWLNGPAYARRFWNIALSKSAAQRKTRCSAVTQHEFMRKKLAAPHLFPLLWASDS